MAELLPLQARWQFEVDLVDIDLDPAITRRFHTRVPVLAIDGEEICQYFLDPEKLALYIEQIAK